MSDPWTEEPSQVNDSGWLGQGCHICGSSDLHRVRRRGLTYRFWRKVLSQRLFRCASCGAQLWVSEQGMASGAGSPESVVTGETAVGLTRRGYLLVIVGSFLLSFLLILIFGID